MSFAQLLTEWLLPGAGFAFFVLGAAANASIAFGRSASLRDARERGQSVSMVAVVPGLIGAISVWNGPFESLRPFFWLPLLLDVGCLPLLALTLIATLARKDAGGDGAAASGSPADEDPAIRHAREQCEKHYRPLAGCLLGTAIGDALGLPAEGLAPQRQARLFPDFERHRLLPFGRGMCSDDTEHTIMVAQSLIETAGDARVADNADAFRRKLACRLRWWLLGLPAGIGMATLRSILKLWLFLPKRWQGTHSAGNAPAMRSALLGVFWAEKPALLRAHVAASTRLTHTDPRAEQAALAVALAAMQAAGGGRVDPAFYAAQMREEFGAAGAGLADLIDRVAQSVNGGESTPQFAASLGLGNGVTGYALHTVPVALHAWLAHQDDYRAAVLAVIRCGGDTDTSAAITGAIVGAATGVEGIPAAWRDGLAEWPHGVGWLLALAATLADVRVHYVGTTAPAASVVKLMVRNLAFIVIVLAHGFRRLMPPY